MTIDPDSLTEERRARPIQRRVLALAAATVVLDGFDIQAVAFVAPGISREWGLAKAALAPVLAAALVGMAAGGYLGGLAGDRWGRRGSLMLSVFLFGVLSLAAAFVQSPGQLVVLRFMTGLGLGAAIPNATALAAEWMPPRHRNLAVTIVNVGVPAGGMVGAAIAAWVIPQFGWRACLALGGVLPLALAALMWIGLPESRHYLTKARRGAPNAARSGGPAAGPAAVQALSGTFATDEPTTGVGGWRRLFSPRYLGSTLGLWLAFFANMAAVYGLFNWTPTLLAARGFPLATALHGSMTLNLFGVLGAFGGVWAVAKMGSRRGLLLLGAIAVLGIGLLFAALTLPTASPLPAMVALAVAGAGVLGLQVGVYALAARSYPTECRATGVGWATGAGRLGSIASAFVVAALLAPGRDAASLFVALAAVLVAAAIGTLVVGPPAPLSGEPA